MSAATLEEGLLWTSLEGIPSAVPAPPVGPTVLEQSVPGVESIRTLGRAISKQGTQAGLCFTGDGHQLPLLQGRAEKEN